MRSHDQQRQSLPLRRLSSSRSRCFYLCPRRRANECREWQGARTASPRNRLRGETAGNRPAINYSLSEIFISQSALQTHSITRIFFFYIAMEILKSSFKSASSHFLLMDTMGSCLSSWLKMIKHLAPSRPGFVFTVDGRVAFLFCLFLK